MKTNTNVDKIDVVFYVPIGTRILPSFSINMYHFDASTFTFIEFNQRSHGTHAALCAHFDSLVCRSHTHLTRSEGSSRKKWTKLIEKEEKNSSKLKSYIIFVWKWNEASVGKTPQASCHVYLKILPTKQTWKHENGTCTLCTTQHSQSCCMLTAALSGFNNENKCDKINFSFFIKNDGISIRQMHEHATVSGMTGSLPLRSCDVCDALKKQSLKCISHDFVGVRTDNKKHTNKTFLFLSQWNIKQQTHVDTRIEFFTSFFFPSQFHRKSLTW